MEDDRRRARRHAVEVPARLLLDDGVEAEVVIRNLGDRGALVSMTDLEVAIREGDRAVLEHTEFHDGKFGGRQVRRGGAVVRVEMELGPQSVLRQLAIYFDQGPDPRSSAA